MTPTVDLAEVKTTLDGAVGLAFRAETAARERPPHSMSASRIFGCLRAAAYAVAGTAPSDAPDPGEGRAANLGTWQHAGLLPRLADQIPGSDYEQPVTLHAAGLDIPGTIDLDVPDGVLDLKTVGEHRLHGLRRIGRAYADHRGQVMSYAVAKAQTGQPVAWVAWLYLDRANGELETIVEPFTNGAAMAVIDRVEQIRDHADTDPDQAPREGRGPGLSLACDGCHWLRRCWGDRARPGETGAQTLLAYDEPGTEQALLMLDDAKARKSAADKDVEFGKAILADTRKGIYGSMSLRRSRPTGDRAEVDLDAVEDHFRTLGLEVPTCVKAGARQQLLVRPVTKLTKKMIDDLASDDVPDQDPGLD